MVAESAAAFVREAPPIEVKVPPTYTRVPSGDAATVRMFSPFGLGFHGSSSPVVALIAARRFRVAIWPLGERMLVNVPPSTIMSPTRACAYAMPLLGRQELIGLVSCTSAVAGAGRIATRAVRASATEISAAHTRRE